MSLVYCYVEINNLSDPDRSGKFSFHLFNNCHLALVCIFLILGDGYKFTDVFGRADPTPWLSNSTALRNLYHRIS
jgi:hypothetical protein